MPTCYVEGLIIPKGRDPNYKPLSFYFKVTKLPKSKQPVSRDYVAMHAPLEVLERLEKEGRLVLIDGKHYRRDNLVAIIENNL